MVKTTNCCTGKRKTVAEQNKRLFEDIGHGVVPTMHPERYTQLSHAKFDLQQNAEKIDVLVNYNSKDDVERVLHQYPAANAWFPLKATAVDMVVLINKEKGEVVKIVDLRPWK